MLRPLRLRVTLALSAAVIAMAATTAVAETGSCNYDIVSINDGVEQIGISVECLGVEGISGFRSEADTKYWHTDAAKYSKGKAEFILDLGLMAREIDDFHGAMPYGQGVLVAPDMLLPLPQTNAEVEFHIRFNEADHGLDVLTALESASDGSYTISSRQIDEAGPVLIGTHIQAETVSGDPELRLVVPDTGLEATKAQLTAWVSATAQSNRRFWSQSPAPGGMIVLVPSSGRTGIPFGRVMSEGGAVVTILVGDGADGKALYDDWVLVHELLHLGSPIMRDTGTWLNEGIATFYEPVLRARAGWKSEDEVWREWISQMPRGMRAMTEIGLSNAGRGGIYWGGAIFVLMAEIEALKASNGAIGFSDCLREALKDGGNTAQRWPTEKLIELSDRMIGGDQLSKLLAAHVQQGSPIDLSTLWKRLGVAMAEDGSIVYDNAAELAWIRPLIIWGGRERPSPISSDGFYLPG